MAQNLLLKDIERKLKKSIAHLEYSLQKVQKLSADVATLDDEKLETWESFSSRFSRVSDIYLTKYVRGKVLENDPGFEGTLRDFVNQGEKIGVVDSADEWMAIRELRNMAAHDYNESELSSFFERLRILAPRLIEIKKLLK